MVTSCAEGAVDALVLNRFFQTGVGTCLEVGAARPDWLSIGALFRAHGWDVLSVEPNPHFAAMHRTLGHDVAEYAASHEDRDDAPFTIVDCHGAAYRDGAVSYESWSSLALKPDYAAIAPALDIRTIKVPVRRLDTILRERRPYWRGIDLLAIDIEGWELEALAGLDFAAHAPQVLIVENLFASAEYRRFMAARGYALWRMSFPNEVWVRDDMLNQAERAACLVTTAAATALIRLRLMAGKMKRALHLSARKRRAPPRVEGGEINLVGIGGDLALNASGDG